MLLKPGWMLLPAEGLTACGVYRLRRGKPEHRPGRFTRV